MRHEAVATELTTMAVLDQEVTVAAMIANNRRNETVRRNTARLQELVRAYGWLSISLVGVEGSHSAWLLVQHADHDREFQNHCLTLMKELPDTEVMRPNIAYLEDRLLVAQGMPQLYGTQFRMTDTGQKPYPISDEAQLDERRAAMGLGPFEEYAMQLREQNRIAPGADPSGSS